MASCVLLATQPGWARGWAADERQGERIARLEPPEAVEPASVAPVDAAAPTGDARPAELEDAACCDEPLAEPGRPASQLTSAEIDRAVAELRRSTKGRLWCVPYARVVSRIDIQGNAGTWWSRAANRYARGQAPESGAVLNFRSTRQLPMGHVAVVSAVISDREILVDQANWIPNKITRGTRVVDVSAGNDWSAVKVENGGGTLGAAYPTFGFIYPKQP